MSRYYSSILNVLSPSFTNKYSIALDGVDDKIQFEAIALGSDYTLSAWAKRLSTANMFLFGNGQTYGYGAYFNGTSNLYFKETNSDLITFNNTAIQTALARTDWVNWVFKKDSTAGTVSVYVDGVLAESTSSVKGMSTITTIGGSGLSSGTQYIWNGNIDEVAIFNTSSVSLDDLGSSTTPKDLSSISGLTAWYRNGDNGTWKSPQWLIPSNENKDKVSNYSFSFDGVDDYIKADINVDAYKVATIRSFSLWVKINTLTTRTPLISGYGIVNLFRYANNFGIVDGRLQWCLEGLTIGTTACKIETELIDGTGTAPNIADGNWHHLALYNAVDSQVNNVNITNCKIYLDGSLLTNDTTQAGTLAIRGFSGGGFVVGAGSSGGSSGQQYLDGNIDEVAYWDNYELTQTQVTDIYNSGTPTTLPSGAIAHYKMGEDATYSSFASAWTVLDAVGSNHGTSANMTLEDRLGEAPSSTNNAVSLNMDEVDRQTDVPT